MSKKKINSGYVTQTVDLESRILKYFPSDYQYFFKEPLFGTSDYANRATYIPNPEIEAQLDHFFHIPKSVLSIFLGYNGMGKSTILKNYLKVSSSDELSVQNNVVTFSKFNWNYNHLKGISYHLDQILHNINFRLCSKYQINWVNEVDTFSIFLRKTDPDLIGEDYFFMKESNDIASKNVTFYELRRFQFILQKIKVKQFLFVIDNIEYLNSEQRYIFINELTECFRLLTENITNMPIIKLLFSLQPDTLYIAQQYECFKDVKDLFYIKQTTTINLEKYFNLKLKYYNKKNNNWEAWTRCLPLFMKVSQKYNRKYDLIIKKLCNYSVPASMRIYSNILSNSKWMHDTSPHYSSDDKTAYFNSNDFFVNNITVIRSIACLEDEMFLSKVPSHLYSNHHDLHSFHKSSSVSVPICNLLYSTESEDYSILILYIIKFFYKYCGQDNFYGHIYQKAWDVIRIFSEIFYGIQDIESKISICISYLYDMRILDKSLKTKPGENHDLDPESRLYLTPRGEILWEMLRWDSVLLEIFREDYYREYSKSSSNNPFCSYVLMHQGKQCDIFADLIRIISDLLEQERNYINEALKNDTITSFKTNFGKDSACYQLLEGLKQSMSYSGLIKDNSLSKQLASLENDVQNIQNLL